MLELRVPACEAFNEATLEFITVKATDLRLEHSLVSISKWESKWKVPFLKKRDRGFSREEIEDYIRCMTISQNVDPNVYKILGQDELKKINDYINDEKTATSFSNLDNSHPNRQVVTSELIYYWMVAYQIPWEAQKWHLSRLLTLIEICNIKNSKEKKMSQRQVMESNAKLNAARRAKLKTRG